MVPSLSLTSLGVSASGLFAYGGGTAMADGLTLVCALSAFVFICSIEAVTAS